MKVPAVCGRIFVLAFVAGCGAPTTGTVRGKVVYKGKPVVTGGVSFVVNGSLPVYAPLKSDGSYEATGVPVGEAIVLVINPPPSPEAVGEDDLAKAENQAKQTEAARRAAREATGWFPTPPKYGDVQTTPLRNTVQPGENTYDVELK